MRKNKKAALRVRPRAQRPIKRASFRNKPSARKGAGKSSARKPIVNKAKDFELKANKMIQKGKDRGFVTYDEILKEFPQIENDVLFLDELYTKFTTANVDVLEGGGLLEVEDLSHKKPVSHLSRNPDSAYDSIQMYLKEIGQYPLINAAMEKPTTALISA